MGDLTFYLFTKPYFHNMKKIILFPCLIITLSAFCQLNPKVKDIKKTPELNKITSVSSGQLPPKEINKNKVKPYKKLTVSKPTDHLLDLKHEPE